MQDGAPRPRAFTGRALLFGLLGGGGIVLFAGFNDEILNQSLLVGNHFPVGAYFYLLALVIVWNPLALWLRDRRGPAARAVGRRLVLSGPELAVVAGIALVACWAPTSGLGRYLNRLVVMPVLRYSTNPTWASVGDYVPERLYPEGRDGWRPDASPEEAARFERVYRDYAQGAARDASLKSMIGPFSWPWRAWLRTLGYWGPLLACFGAAGVAMAFLVRTQWARREQLAYPLATVAAALVERDERRRVPDVFRSKLFLWALGLVVGVHLLRWTSRWHPDLVPDPAMEWTIPFRDLWPTMHKSGWYREQQGGLYFSIIGITYFLAGEIGLTLGVSQVLLAVLATQFYMAAGQPLSGENLNMSRLGAYAAYAVMFLWVGREWYRAAFLRALWGCRPDLPDDARAAAHAARTLAVAGLGFWATLVAVGEVDWLVAGAFTVFLHLTLVVFMRLVCETGLPFLNVHELHIALARLAGYAAVGPQAVATLNLTHEALWRDPRECLPPYAATATELAARNRVPAVRLLRWLAVAAVVAAGLAWWVRNWGDYNWGAFIAQDPMSHTSGPRTVMAQAATIHTALRYTDLADAAERATGLGRLALLGPERGALPWFLAGAAGVVGLTLARYRWRAWPLHPALLLVWNTYPLQMMSHCFLIGWAVKTLVMRFGGGRVYQKLKPWFLGMLVGEIAVGGLFILFGAVYYFATGDIPKRYLVLPQ